MIRGKRILEEAGRSWKSTGRIHFTDYIGHGMPDLLGNEEAH